MQKFDAIADIEAQIERAKRDTKLFNDYAARIAAEDAVAARIVYGRRSYTQRRDKVVSGVLIGAMLAALILASGVAMWWHG